MRTSRKFGCYKCRWAKNTNDKRIASPENIWECCVHCIRNPNRTEEDHHETEAQYRTRIQKEDRAI